MTPVSQPSSSNSWSRSGADATAPPDIIDLDRYMRTARPQAHHGHRGRDSERLVVDNGGARNKSGGCSSYKRYSHDSGLSDDGSYGLRQRGRLGATSRDAPRATDSTHSMRKFRVACERALRDQQHQIAQMAQLCDRLKKTTHSPAAEASLSSDSSASSSTSGSGSARDRRRKDNVRSDECKTYKIIMTKLDELNRMFVARGRSPTHPGAVVAAMARRRLRAVPASSSSVSVSDKVVATEPEPQLPMPQMNLLSERVVTRVVERAVGHSQPPSLTRVREARESNACDSPRHGSHTQHAFSVHRLVKCSSTEEINCSVTSNRRRASSGVNHFEQDYSKTKRAQPCRRTCRAESSRGLRRRGSTSGGATSGGATSAARNSSAAPSGQSVRGSSLCRMCREYWRTFTDCLAAQIFYQAAA